MLLALIDVVRFVDFVLFGIGCGFMLVTNILASHVLRGPKRFGFLWWHVTAISLSFLSLGSVAIWLVFANLGHEPNWRTFVTFFGFFTFCVAQVCIFFVEFQRYAAVKAVEKNRADLIR